MVLNNLPQQIAIYFDVNSFYPEIQETWLPVLRRMGTPYMSVEDFMNAQIQSFNLPQISTTPGTQQIGQFQISKRPGKDVTMLMEKNISFTFKLTESYISYFIARMQYDLYLRLFDVKPLYMSPVTFSLIDDSGMETISYIYYQLTPTNLSELSFSYAAKLASYNTFNWGFRYNYFDIYYRNPKGFRELLYSSKEELEAETRNLINDRNNKHQGL